MSTHQTHTAARSRFWGETLKIEFLYTEGCPHWEATLADLRVLVATAVVDAEIEAIPVNTLERAQQLEFPGSPTVRIDGEDVDLDLPETPFGLECREYDVEGEMQNRPPSEWIMAALEATDN